MNVKTERLASTIHKELQGILVRGLHDPRIRGLVTVTRIEIVDEGRIARAYISVLPEEKAKLTMHGLQDATTHLRRALMEQVRVRTMPLLEIRYDEQARKQAETLKAIAQAAQVSGLHEPGPQEDDAGNASGDGSDATAAGPASSGDSSAGDGSAGDRGLVDRASVNNPSWDNRGPDAGVGGERAGD